MGRLEKKLSAEAEKELRWNWEFYSTLLITLYRRLIESRNPQEQLTSARLLMAALRGMGAWDGERYGYSDPLGLMLLYRNEIVKGTRGKYIDLRDLYRDSTAAAIDQTVEKILEDSLDALVRKGVIPTASALTIREAI